MPLWLGLLAGSTGAGACFVGLLVAPRRSQFIAFFGLILSSVLIVRMFSLIAAQDATSAIGLAVFFVIAGIAGGYWAAAAALPHAIAQPKITPSVTDAEPRELPALILLSCAEAERYRIASTARVIERLVTSDALRLPTSALPFVFLSEKSRYRALGDYNPARAGVMAVADRVAEILNSDFGTVTVAWCDGSPTLRTLLADLESNGYRSAVLATLGPEGSFVTMEAEHEALEGASGVQLIQAESIWRSDHLAARLVERVIESCRGAQLSEVGVLLAGEGQPVAWEPLGKDWCERENYFNQRVKLMLLERGFQERNIRISWIEWQAPDITETVRHLAALGCNRLVIAPTTLPHITLASALDLKRSIEAARLAEEVRVVTLTPWGDDAGIVQAVADTAHAALARHAE
ncbi:MAG: hypothetical protein CVT66_03730 [Actinobacteria bacterium HGW-Actinobacteria-6]|nr:MAG: hypothetical protein CVT66_03730 [Actinobacteria bacterium HGW-Actinobacteria-6]